MLNLRRYADSSLDQSADESLQAGESLKFQAESRFLGNIGCSLGFGELESPGDEEGSTAEECSLEP